MERIAATILVGVIGGLGSLVLYLGYWHTEAEDCHDNYLGWKAVYPKTDDFEGYLNCLRYKHVPVFEDMKAPEFDFVAEPGESK